MTTAARADAGRPRGGGPAFARHAGKALNNCSSDWSPEQHAELAAMLDKLSRALIGERADEHIITR